MDARRGVVFALAVCALLCGAAAGAEGRELVLVPRLDDSGARALLNVSERLVWDRDTGVALAEVLEGGESLEALRVLGFIRLGEIGMDCGFEDAVASLIPDFRPGVSGGRFAAAVPMSRVRPPGAPVRSFAADGHVPESTCLTQGFETASAWQESGGSWLHYEGGYSNASGDYYWKDTSCDAASGSRAADAVRGGALGNGLTCTAYYATYTESWLEYDPLITCAHSASYARMAFKMKLACETNYDYLFCGFSTDGYHYSGYGYTGAFTSSWYWVAKNMRSWYSLGDLANYSSLTLAFVFVSDYSINSGFGARVDDVVVSTDPLPSVASMTKMGSPFRFVVNGIGFQKGVRVWISGTEWTNVAWKKSNKVKIGGGAALKSAVPRGVSKTFQFVNPDGGSVSYSFSW